MKIYLRITIIALAISALLVVAVPAAAEALRTEVNGTMIFYNEPENPESRAWVSDQYIYHWRDALLEYQWVFNDERLNGYQQIYCNGEAFFAGDWESLRSMHIYCKGTTYADAEFTIPTWECSNNGDYNEQSIGIGEVVCHGAGANEGLQARLTITDLPENFPNIIAEGYILDPGGE